MTVSSVAMSEMGAAASTSSVAGASAASGAPANEPTLTFADLYPVQSDKSRAVPGSAQLPFAASSFKALCEEDGCVYLLRRVAGCWVDVAKARENVSAWMLLQRQSSPSRGAGAAATAASAAASTALTLGGGAVGHPHIVALRHLFMTSDFADKRSLCMVYDYHPGAVTLFQRHFSGTAMPVTEERLWSLACQLASALSAIHGAGLCAMHMLDPIGSRVLLLPSGRVKLMGAGYVATATQSPALSSVAAQTMAVWQHDDIVNLGKLLVAVASSSLSALQSSQSVAAALARIAATLSKDAAAFISMLLSPPVSGPFTIAQVTSVLAPRMVAELQAVSHVADFLDAELAKERHNGRLLRLVMKLGYVNEVRAVRAHSLSSSLPCVRVCLLRCVSPYFTSLPPHSLLLFSPPSFPAQRPEYLGDPMWSETGDRYLLKLFRDFLFHQVGAEGAPAVDFGFTVDALNKLDAGAEEKVLLSNRQVCSPPLALALFSRVASPAC